MKPLKTNTKYSLFKSNRSQASLLSNQSFQERVSHQASPIDSPLHSPAFPPPSAQSSPLGPEDKERDDAFARASHEADAAKFYQANPASKPNVLQRSQSHRASPSPRSVSGPTINLVSPTHGAAGATRIDENPNSFYQNTPQISNKIEHKKKRRFFGFGDSSSGKEGTTLPAPEPPRGLGRSISVRRTAPVQQIVTNTGDYATPQQWPSGSTSAKFPSPTVDEEPEPRESLHPNSPYGAYSAIPPIPPKDPPRSAILLPSSGSDHRHTEGQPQSSTTAASSKPQLAEQVGSKTPAWEKIGRTPAHHRNQSSDVQPQYQAFQPAPSTASSGSSYPVPSRSTQDLAYPQPQYSRDSRPSSRQSYEPPSPTHSQSHPSHLRTSSLQASPLYGENSMAPQSSQQHAGRASTEQGQQNTQAGLGRGESSYNAYGQGGQGQNQSAQTTGQYGSQLAVNNNQSGGTYRNTPQPSPMVAQNSNSELGRSTPPPSRSRDDLSGLDVQQLLARHDELNDKYRKVKKYYFDKDAQVQQLQNTLAHQRLSQSRTSLDDNEYATRFSRLDGAINNLAFNIRKEWRTVPPWLSQYVNREATSLGTKEMTAVGRACISRWIVDELLDRSFHPALEPNLSCQLKIIEKNLRRFAPPTPTEEEREALLAKISNWRLSTLDGLQDMLASPDAMEYRATITEMLVKMLTGDLMMNLKDPPPPGLEVGVVGIIELAVGIAANLPLESRDVYVDYIMPGTLVNDSYMKVEGALPALTNPGEGLEDRHSISSISDKSETDRESVKDMSLQQQGQQQQKKKPGMLSGLMGKKPAAAAQSNSTRGGGNASNEAPQAPKEERVRFAAFMSVEVRGKTMLIKAPVYI